MLDALPGVVVNGTVDHIAPVATFEGGVVYYDVFIGLATTDEPVRVDMSANATIVVEELVDVLQVPTWIVRVDRRTGQTYVDRQTGDGTERVDVDLGIRHEGVAEVLNGLSEGDVLVWVDEAAPFGLGGS
jgi:multidrug efflux pump subunit AcrA (membrane-fusion protein)